MDEFATQVKGDLVISKDIVVFEWESDLGKYIELKLKRRLWVLRSNRLPIRLNIYGSSGFQALLVFSYSKKPREEFLDPKIFETKLKDPSNSVFDLPYMGLEDTGRK
jgi:hypothetical protein